MTSVSRDPDSEAAGEGCELANRPIPLAFDLAGGLPVNAMLRLAVALTRSIVGAAEGVSVSLQHRGRLTTIAASDQTILAMDDCQYATGEGPCVDASVEGCPVHVESLSTELRWPAFTPGARALGIKAILSSPLLASKRPIGALNIYSRQPSVFDLRDQSLASVLAAEVSKLLTEVTADGTDDHWSDRLQDALRARQVIARAEGMIMERSGVSGDEAYTILRTHSQRTSQPIREEAEALVTSVRRNEPGPQSGPGGDSRDHTSS